LLEYICHYLFARLIIARCDDDRQEIIDKVGYFKAESRMRLFFEPGIVYGHIDEIEYSGLVQLRQFEHSQFISFLQSNYQFEYTTVETFRHFGMFLHM